MPDKAQRETRKAQRPREIEQNQDALRRSIAESQKLIDKAVETNPSAPVRERGRRGRIEAARGPWPDRQCARKVLIYRA